MKPTLASALSCLVVCLTFSASSSYAQPGPAPNGEPPGRVGLDQDPGNDNIGYAVAVPFGPWLSIDGTFGDGIGWEDGFVTASAFVPRHINPGTDLMFAMVNLSVAENGQGAINLGSGYRYRAASLNRIFGFSGWADIDDGHDEPYWRVGLSLESLGKYLDYRLNTYLVMESDTNKVRDFYTSNTPFFQNNYLMLERQKVFEAAYSGADFEMGGQVPFLGRYGISAYAGPYFLRHEEFEDAFGVKARLEAQINEDLTLSAQFSNDDVFSNATYVNLAWTIPDGRPTRWFRPRPMKERMALPVARERRIAVHRKIQREHEPLINPNNGLPLFFKFVSDNAAANGIGTHLNPSTFANLTNGPGVDVILISSTDSLINQSRAGSLTLFNNQRVLGTAITQQVTALQGTFTIPGTGPGGIPLRETPQISNNLNGNVIQLANNNEVSGLIISGAQQGTGILNAAPINNVNLNNLIVRNLANGVNLTNATGTVFVNNNAFNLNNPAGLNTGVGFQLNNNAGGVANLTFTNNTAQANGTGFLSTAQGGSVINITAGNNVFDDNTAPNTGFSLLAQGAGSQINLLSFTNNTVTDSINGNNIRIAADTGALITINNFTGNTISGAGRNGMLVTADGLGTQITANIGTLGATANTFTGNGILGIGTLGTNGGNAMHFVISDDALLQGSIVNNTMTNHANGRGIFVQATDNTVNGVNTTLDFGATIGGGLAGFAGAISNNTITGMGTAAATNAFGGIQFNTDNTILDLLAQTNTIGTVANVNRGAGLAVTMTGNHQLNFIAGGDPTTGVQNFFNSNVDAGIAVSMFGTQIAGTQDFVTIQGNSILNTTDNAATVGNGNPQGDGIFLQRRDDVLLTAVVGNAAGQNGRGNQIQANVNGLRMFASGNFPVPAVGGQPIQLRFDTNVFQQNTNDGTAIDVGGAAVLLATGLNNFYDRNTNEGIQVTTSNNSALGDPRNGAQSQFLGNVMTKAVNTGSGYAFVAQDASLQNVLISNNGAQRATVTGGANGITIASTSSAFDPATLPTRNTWTVTNTDISNVNADGINATLTGTGGGVVNVGPAALGALNNVTITGAGDDGIDVTSALGTNTINITNTTVTGSGRVTGGGTTAATRGDGVIFQQTGGNFTVNMQGSSSTFSAGRGLTIEVLGANFPAFAAQGGLVSGSVFNIGGFGAGQGNTLANNAMQGAYVETRSTLTASTNFLTLDPAVFGDIYNDFTNQTRLDSRVRFRGNNIQSSTGADGLVLAIGTNTRLRADVTANIMGGNAGTDFVVRPIFSNVQAVTASVNNAVAGPPILDQVQNDPTARLDLVFGIRDLDANATPETAAGNIGNTIFYSSTGSATAFAGTTQSGAIALADIFKPGGRTVEGVFNIFSANNPPAVPGDDLLTLFDPVIAPLGVSIANGDTGNGNDFRALGVLQNVRQIFVNDPGFGITNIVPIGAAFPGGGP